MIIDKIIRISNFENKFNVKRIRLFIFHWKSLCLIDNSNSCKVLFIEGWISRQYFCILFFLIWKKTPRTLINFFLRSFDSSEAHVNKNFPFGNYLFNRTLQWIHYAYDKINLNFYSFQKWFIDLKGKNILANISEALFYYAQSLLKKKRDLKCRKRHIAFNPLSSIFLYKIGSSRIAVVWFKTINN